MRGLSARTGSGWFSLSVLCALTALGLVPIALRTTPVAGLSFVRTACTPQPHWEVVFSADEGSIGREGQGWNLWGQGAIGTAVCGSGTLVVTAEGQEAAGSPELTVLLDGQQIATRSFSVPQTVSVRIPRGGNLHLAYLNDYYRSEVRLGILRDFRLDAPECRLLDGQVPPENGGRYDPVARDITLVGPQPATVMPCQPGRMTFYVSGREAQGTFPVIRIEQGNRVLAEVEAPATARQVALDVSAEPVRLTLLNPYARQLADRNLLIRSLRWQPD